MDEFKENDGERYGRESVQLDLSTHLLGRKPWSKFLKSVNSMSNITHLDLSKNKIQDQRCSALAQVIGQFRVIQELSLAQNLISDDGFSFIIQSLKTAQTLQVLNFSGNKLSDRSCHEFASMVEQERKAFLSLTKLDFSENEIGAFGLIMLFPPLKQSGSLHVSMAGNPVPFKYGESDMYAESKRYIEEGRLICEFGKTEIDRWSIAKLLGVQIDDIPRRLFLLQEINFDEMDAVPIRTGSHAQIYKFGDYIVKAIIFVQAQAQKFVSELRNWSQLPYHRNIVQFVGLIRPKKLEGEEFQMSFVLDRYDCALSDMVTEKRLSPIERLDALCQISSALSHLHLRNIAHMDLHPHNVLVVGKERFAITDFDRSLDLNGTSNEHRLTFFSGMYECILPPEADVDEEEKATVGLASDVFSFGILIWHILNFSDLQEDLKKAGSESTSMERGHSTVIRLHNWIRQQKCREGDLPAETAKKLWEIMMKCLNESLNERPTAQEVKKWCSDVKSAYLNEWIRSRRN
jgi:hypothetical protein